jgi:hypothetical protein
MALGGFRELPPIQTETPGEPDLMDCRTLTTRLGLMCTVAAGPLAAGCAQYPIDGSPIPEGPVVPAVPPPPPATPPAPPPVPPVAPVPPPAPPSPPPANGLLSRAAQAWTPGPEDTCTQTDHMRYTAVGPDGKLYPTWHPPVDPSGCTFGHEHGRDPSGAGLDDMGTVIFGYANERLDEYPGRSPRHEDHVGHKIEWGRDVRFNPSGATGGAVPLTCNVLAKLHQGTHSPDAFTNNLHEIIYRIRCDDGSEANVTFLTANGPAGQLSRRCRTSEKIAAGVANPADSPTQAHPRSPGHSMGNRFIPDRWCLENTSASTQLSEIWKTQNLVTTADNRLLFRFATYFSVSDPSRFFDPGAANNLGRAATECYATKEDGSFRINSSGCRTARAFSGPTPAAWNSPSSYFVGARRSVRFNDFMLTNSGDRSVWYTDPFGQNARPEPFPGSIEQRIAAKVHTGVRFFTGPTIAGNYRGPGVHAPN